MKEACQALYEKTGGFLKGICHPRGDYEMLTRAGLRWVRRDIDYPFDASGGWAEGYLQYKQTCRDYASHGIRHVAVTPYPDRFLENGIDVRTEMGLQQAEEVCARMAAD